MRTWIFVALLLCAPLFVAPAFAGDAETAAMAPVHQFIGDVNKGDMKAAAATFASDASIIDEFAPYHWQGNDAFAQWGADFDTMAKVNGISDMVLTLEPPRHVHVTGDRGYAVVPALIVSRHNGKTARERGTFTFALTNTAMGWRIAAWAWATR